MSAGPAPGWTGGVRRASLDPDARRSVPLLAVARRCRHDQRRGGQPPRDPRQWRRGRDQDNEPAQVTGEFVQIGTIDAGIDQDQPTLPARVATTSGHVSGPAGVPPKRTLVPRAGFPAVLARLSASPIVSARGSLLGDATGSSADQAHHLVQVSRCVLLGLASVGVLGPCGLTSSASTTQRTSPDAAEATTTAMASAARVSGGQTSVSGGQTSMDAAPTRFTIRPDDYHVPYAGTAEDGRRFS
jgi:hypothetical protein